MSIEKYFSVISQDDVFLACLVILNVLKILTQQLPLEEIFTNSSEAEIFHYLVVDNKRPELPAHLPEALTSIITRAWDSDATLRPSAAEIITVLESIYADELAEL